MRYLLLILLLPCLCFGLTITVTSPNGGETWKNGTNHNITWTTNISSGQVDIQLDKAYPSSWEDITRVDATSSPYSWDIALGDFVFSYSNTCRIRIIDHDTGLISDISNANFTLRDTLALTSPNGGESWQYGSVHNITWNLSGEGGETLSLSVSLYPSSGGWEAIVGSLPNNGSYAYTVNIGTYNTALTFKLENETYPAIADSCDGSFVVTPASSSNPDRGTSSTIGGKRKGNQGFTGFFKK
jgi:hypothetical protein